MRKINKDRGRLLDTFPTEKGEAANGFLSGAQSVLSAITTDGDDPMDVDIEYDNASLSWGVYLITGKWVGPHDPDFSDCYTGDE